MWLIERSGATILQFISRDSSLFEHHHDGLEHQRRPSGYGKLRTLRPLAKSCINARSVHNRKWLTLKFDLLLHLAVPLAATAWGCLVRVTVDARASNSLLQCITIGAWSSSGWAIDAKQCRRNNIAAAVLIVVGDGIRSQK